MVDPIKRCETCGVKLKRRRRDSNRQWEERTYCSVACSNDGKKDEPTHLRFWRHAYISDGNRCWIWGGVKDQYGYGRIAYRTQSLKAHRVAFEMRHGPIPDDMVICHSCDNPSCVNPNHLFVGSQSENMQDASRKGRLNPKSLGNLRPGAAGFHGAGPISNKEIEACREL